jgi:hypothetical protein
MDPRNRVYMLCVVIVGTGMVRSGIAQVEEVSEAHIISMYSIVYNSEVVLGK